MTGRRHLAVPVLAAGIALVLGVSGVALATSTPKTIKACVSGKGYLGVPSAKGKCAKHFAALTLGAQGPRGATGPQGAVGLDGLSGRTGVVGVAGPTGSGPVAVVSGPGAATPGDATLPNGLSFFDQCSDNNAELIISNQTTGDTTPFTVAGTVTTNTVASQEYWDTWSINYFSSGTTVVNSTVTQPDPGVTFAAIGGGMYLNLVVTQGTGQYSHVNVTGYLTTTTNNTCTTTAEIIPAVS